MILDCTTVTGPCLVMYLCTAVKFSVNAVWISKTRRLLALLQYIGFQMPYDTKIIKIFFRWSNRGETPPTCSMLDNLSKDFRSFIALQ